MVTVPSAVFRERTWPVAEGGQGIRGFTFCPRRLGCVWAWARQASSRAQGLLRQNLSTRTRTQRRAAPHRERAPIEGPPKFRPQTIFQPESGPDPEPPPRPEAVGIGGPDGPRPRPPASPTTSASAPTSGPTGPSRSHPSWTRPAPVCAATTVLRASVPSPSPAQRGVPGRGSPAAIPLWTAAARAAVPLRARLPLARHRLLRAVQGHLPVRAATQGPRDRVLRGVRPTRGASVQALWLLPVCRGGQYLLRHPQLPTLPKRQAIRGAEV